MRSSLPVARPAADLGQPCAPPVGLSLATAAQGSEDSPAARNTLDSARIPRASKLLICGLFQKGRVLAQDAIEESELQILEHGPTDSVFLNIAIAFLSNVCHS